MLENYLSATGVVVVGVIGVFTLLLANAIAGCVQRARDQRIDAKCEELVNLPASRKPVPVTVVTGFLGAGKTVLLNNILRNPLGHRICVIENEAGAVSIDHTLLQESAAGSKSDIIVLKNGCMCCAATGPGDELERTLDRILQIIHEQHENSPQNATTAEKPFDYLVIETSGLVDPTPIIQTFFRSDVSVNFSLDAVVTVVDAKNILGHLEGGFLARTREAELQIALADIILLNKIDIADERTKVTVENAIRERNPSAELMPCSYCDTPTASLLNRQKFDVERAAQTLQSTINIQSAPHRAGITTITIASEISNEVLQLDALKKWLQGVVAKYWQSLYRVKGVVMVRADNTDKPFVFHGVHEELHGSLTSLHGDVQSAIVLIGRNLDAPEIRRSFAAACLALPHGTARQTHQHDEHCEHEHQHNHANSIRRRGRAHSNSRN